MRRWQRLWWVGLLGSASCSGGQSGTESFDVLTAERKPEGSPSETTNAATSSEAASVDSPAAAPSSPPDDFVLTPEETRVVPLVRPIGDEIERWVDFYLEPCEGSDELVPWCSRISEDGVNFVFDDSFMLASYEWGYRYHVRGRWVVGQSETGDTVESWDTIEELSKERPEPGSDFTIELEASEDASPNPRISLTSESEGELLRGPAFTCHPRLGETIESRSGQQTFALTFQFDEDYNLFLREVRINDFVQSKEVEEQRDAWLAEAPDSYVVKACSEAPAVSGCTVMAVQGDVVVEAANEVDGESTPIVIDGDEDSLINTLFDMAYDGIVPTDGRGELLFSYELDPTWGYVSHVQGDWGEGPSTQDIVCFAADTLSLDECP